MKFFLITLLCIVANVSFAQYKGYNRYTKNFNFNARINPFTMLRINDAAIVVGVEKKIKKQMSLGADLGYIFYSTQLLNQNNGKISGFLIRPAFRYFTTSQHHFFIEGAVTYQNITEKQTDWLGMNCVNDIPAYEELKEFKLQRKTYDLSARIGASENIFKSKKLFIEAFAGIGIKYRTVLVKNHPRACFEFEGANIFFTDNNRFTPGTSVFAFVPVGVKIGYVLK